MRSSSATSDTVFTMRPQPCARRCGHAAADRSDRPHEVHREDTLELLLGDRLDRAAAPPTGASTTGQPRVVHDDVDLSERIHRTRHRSRRAFERGDVAVVGDRLTARAANLRHDRVGDGLVAATPVELGADVAHDHPSAPLCEQEGVRTTDASSSPGHDGDPTLQGDSSSVDFPHPSGRGIVRRKTRAVLRLGEHRANTSASGEGGRQCWTTSCRSS